MKLEEVVRRALEDEEFAERLRGLAYRARDNGMLSKDYAQLVELVAETKSDLKTMNTTLMYTQTLAFTTSKHPLLCTRLPRWPTLGGLAAADQVAPRLSTRAAGAKTASASRKKSATKTPAKARPRSGPSRAPKKR